MLFNNILLISYTMPFLFQYDFTNAELSIAALQHSNCLHNQIDALAYFSDNIAFKIYVNISNFSKLFVHSLGLCIQKKCSQIDCTF